MGKKALQAEGIAKALKSKWLGRVAGAHWSKGTVTATADFFYRSSPDGHIAFNIPLHAYLHVCIGLNVG